MRSFCRISFGRLRVDCDYNVDTVMKKLNIEKWYADELKSGERKRRLEKIGLNPSFMFRKKRRNFSVIAFIVYVFKKIKKEIK